MLRLFFSKLFSSRFFLVLEIVVLILICWSLQQEIFREKKLREEISKLKQETLDIKEENELYSSKLDYLNSKAFLEKEAREKLFFKKEGEEMVVITEKKSKEEGIKKEGTVLEKDQKTENLLEKIKKWWQTIF